VIGCHRIVTCGYYSEKDAARCVNEMLEAVKVIIIIIISSSIIVIIIVISSIIRGFIVRLLQL